MCNNQITLVRSNADFKYEKAYNRALTMMVEFYDEGHNLEDFQKIFIKKYIDNNLDPDGNAVLFAHGVKCTADGLHSIKRICSFEKNTKDIIKTYRDYRKFPIFFFPSEKGGINTSRFRIFGDRIDHTLYDIKMYYTDNIIDCKLKSAFNKPNTSLWLEKMESFENIVDWLKIKGIFTDNNYNVYDLEYSDPRIIKQYKNIYCKQWSKKYYENLKKKILEFYNKNRIFQ